MGNLIPTREPDQTPTDLPTVATPVPTLETLQPTCFPTSFELGKSKKGKGKKSKKKPNNMIMGMMGMGKGKGRGKGKEISRHKYNDDDYDDDAIDLQRGSSLFGGNGNNRISVLNQRLREELESRGPGIR
jgi:hypothetical protein